MTILEYYEGMAAAKRATMPERGEQPLPMTKEKLRYMYGSYVVASRKKKGAGKGYKETYKWQWRDYRGYRNALRELFPKDYALMLCREQHECFVNDRWWDTPDYRGEAIRDYRSDIQEIKLQYGLTRSEVAPFMKVG